MAWICDKNGNHRCEIKQLSYNGTFMEVSSITVTVESPAPIAFAIGDYIDWDYDGLRYTLDTAAGVEKQATRNSVGNAFIYENLVFLSPLKAAENADFFDVILGNTNDFLTNTEFSFYGTAWDYAKRLEANLCRLYGSGTWKVRIWTNGTCYDATPATGIDTGAWENKLVDVAGIKCLGGFKQIYDLWGCAYVFSVVNGVNYVDFYDDFEQYAKTWQEGGMDKIFAYGKGNGLYKIRHTPDADHVLVTRLRPYGSGDNLPPNYYLNSEDYHVDGNESSELAISHLMLPASQWTKDGVKHPANAYLEQNTDLYGVREGVVLWDGSDPELGEIKPSIYGLTIQDLLNLMASGDSYRPDEAKWPDTTQRIDKIITGAAPTDNGVKNESGYDFTEIESSGSLAEHSFGTGGAYIDVEFNDLVMGTTPSVSHLAEFRIVPTSENKVAASFDVQASVASAIRAVNAYLTPYVGGIKISDATYPCTVTEEAISNTVEGITYTKRYKISLLDSTGNPIVFSSMYTGNVTFRIVAHIDFNGNPTGFPVVRNEYAVSFNLLRGNKTIDEYFSVTIPQIGFDLSAAVANGAKLCMRSGANQPREFQIIPSSVRYLPDTDTWFVRCKRSVDQSISTYFPNSNSVIAAGDEYYFTGIAMPPLYVEIAAQKLLTASTAWLALHSKPRMLSAVDVDNKIMAVEEIVLKEGMSLPLSDTDLGITPQNQESRVIDNIRIEEGSDPIRTFTITLRDKKEKSSLDAAIRGATSNLATNASVSEAVNAATGTGHGSLTGRDMPNQHPISAITGLEEALLSSGFFEYDPVSGVVKLKSDYDYLGPKKGLVFDAYAVGATVPNFVDLCVKTVQIGNTTQRVLYSTLPLITKGDQIVENGTPGGGGGGGGVSYLHELLDVYGNPGDVQRADGTDRQSGDLLGYNSTLDKWVAIAQSAIAPDLSDYYTKSQTDSAIATAITALGLGAAATYDVASSVTQNDTSHLVTGAAVYSAINTAISSAIKFQGITTTALTDGSTTNPITIDGQSFTAKRGDEVIYGGKEFLWTGSKWQQLGDEESWANKTITISAGTGLTGGGNLESNRTISLSQDSIDKLGLAASALQSSNIKTLTIQLDGTTVGSAYNPIGSANHTVNIAKSSLSSLLSDTFHPYGGSTTLATFKIGGATITWHAASGSTPGYIEIDSALVTQGDQIVVSGTPGGGGGGAGWLYELGDVYGTTAVLRADGTQKQVGDVLQYYDSTKGWVAVPSTSIGITTDATQSVHGLMSAADKTKLDYVGFGTAGSDYVPIYLGGSTPTNVLTAHQSLSGYATENWVGTYYLPITSTKVAQVRYLNFRNSRAGTTEISGYVGAGASGSDYIQLSAYSGYGLSLGGDRVTIERGDLYFGSTSYYITGGGQANLATCSVGGSAVLTSGNYSSTLASVYHPKGGSNTLDLQAKSLSVYADAGDGEGISLYRDTSFIGSYGIMFAQTTNFGTHGTVTGAWATYFNSQGYGWIFRNGSYGAAASINYQGHFDLNGQIRFAYNDDNSTIGRRYSSSDNNCYGYIKFYQGLIGDNSHAGIEYYAGHDTSGITSAHRFLVGMSDSVALDIRNNGKIGLGKISDNNYDVEVGGSLNATSLYQNGYSIYSTGNLSPVTTNTSQVINGIKSTPYVYFYSYASESTPVGYVGRGSNDNNNIQLSSYYSNISISAAGDVYLASYSNTNLTLKNNYYTYVLTGDYNTMPSLGALGVRTFAIKPSSTGDYGLFMWSFQQTGGGYLQCGYNDGTPYPLDMYLQPLGGKVAIGGSGTAPSYKVDMWNELARLRYLNFCDAAGTGVAGYVGRGSSGNDVELKSYSGAVYLGGYSQNQIALKSGTSNIGIGTTDPAGCITLGDVTKFHTTATAKIGQAYGTVDTNLYNWIQFYGGGGGITFVSGTWTGGDVDAFKFCGGGGTSDVIFYMASRGQAVFYRQVNIQDNLITTGDQAISSDRTKKKNLVPITLTAEQIANAPAISFDWKDGHGHSFGSIAQYWKPLVPEAVLGKEGDYTLAYGQLGVVLGINNGKAIYKIEQHESEQDKEIRLLKEKVKKQAGEIRGLKKEIERLRMN